MRSVGADASVLPRTGRSASSDLRRCKMIADVDQLYRGFNGALERIVRRDVTAPTVVIEDACQTAWVRLVRHAQRIEPDGVRGWLATTAVREAVRLWRRDQRETPLDGQLDEDGEVMVSAPAPSTEELAEWREQIALVGGLSYRQRRVLWLKAWGLSYEEIAAESGLTVRTVERQLYRARTRLRAAA
jgi:RNA polymerase sigma factor (sigma-70 family)